MPRSQPKAPSKPASGARSKPRGPGRLSGAELLVVAPGRVEIGFPFRPELGRQDRFFHASGRGLATLADDAAGFAALGPMRPDHRVLTVEFEVDFLASGIGERAIARGEVVRSGRTLTVARAEVAVVRESSERPVALLLATMMALPPAVRP